MKIKNNNEHEVVLFVKQYNQRFPISGLGAITLPATTHIDPLLPVLRVLNLAIATDDNATTALTPTLHSESNKAEESTRLELKLAQDTKAAQDAEAEASIKELALKAEAEQVEATRKAQEQAQEAEATRKAQEAEATRKAQEAEATRKAQSTK